MDLQKYVTITWKSDADQSNPTITNMLSNWMDAQNAIGKTDGKIENLTSTITQTKWIDQESAESFVFHLDKLREEHAIDVESIVISGIPSTVVLAE